MFSDPASISISVRPGKLAATALAAVLTVVSAAQAQAQTQAVEEATEAAVRESEQAVIGLQAPAEILIDQWGVAHIYAANARDAFFLQGYNAARDRLWQIDLWRKRGLGLLARDFGPSFVAQDRAARLFLYRGDMEAEWAAYGPDARDHAEAFVAGINAFVGEIRDGGRPLPTEFEIAGTTPDLWQPSDVVRIRSHGLIGNVEDEVRRARVVCAAGLEADAYRVRLEPEWTTRVPEGLDPCSVPRDVLRDYTLATQGVSFASRGSAPGARAGLEVVPASHPDISAIGSNNWAVAGARTDTGRPILASDPHRSHSLPSLRYIVHLNAPGLSVIGAGEPALPGVSIGHNGTIAFGLTIFSVDQEDLQVYELDEAGQAYRYGDGWEPIRTLTETVEVRGGPSREVKMQFTRHGPVLKVEADARRAWAVRSVWLEPGTSAYFGSVDYMVAGNWDEFTGAMARWGTPSENQVFADTSGNIGWIAAGKTPRRTRHDGLMPVPGDGRYEWQGFLTASELPHSFNPSEGWVATANQMNLPADYPVDERRIGFEWADPSRYERIAEVLTADEDFSVDEAMALQNDTQGTLQRRFVALTRMVEPKRGWSALNRQALSLVQGWDAHADRDSRAATVAEVWMNRYLSRELTRVLYPDHAAAIGRPSARTALERLEAMDGPGRDGASRRDAVLQASLEAAVADLSGRLGDDPAQWTYGRLHTAQFTHGLSPLASRADQARLKLDPISVGGTWSSPIASNFSTDFKLLSGASFRMVLDVGDWDNSQAVNTPGQSGDPASPHFGDLAPLWAEGRYFPLLYSRPAVEGATTEKISLVPAPIATP
ncbi:penicillin acylase family protein [Brevundimonas bullata]|uniref:penicillin acylase family protein n=1 Tax=Brevundimonas bullata TaxID=13160 RepID=UPI002FDAF83D